MNCDLCGRVAGGRVAGVGAQRNPGVFPCGTPNYPGLPSLRFVQPRPPRCFAFLFELHIVKHCEEEPRDTEK